MAKVHSVRNDFALTKRGAGVIISRSQSYYFYGIYPWEFDEVNVIGYCVRCRAKQEMLSATRTLMKNGRRAMIGLCACCGTKMSVAGKWDDDSALPAPEADKNGLLGLPKNG